MKTKNLQTKLIVSALFLFGLFCTSSCHSQQDSQVVKKPATDIHTAIISNNMDAFQDYIKSGKSINEKEAMDGSSPLITTAVFGKTEMAKMLIDSKADLNMQNKEGSTALHTAAFFCRPAIVKMLLAKGANKSIKNKYGQTAYGTVSGSYAEVKEIYKGFAAMLEPVGLKLDFAYIERTRPQIASLLK